MNAIQRQQIIDDALPCVEPLRAALDSLPTPFDTLTEQCRNAGRSLTEWVERLAAESPVGTPDAAIPRETLLHVATIANYASGAAYKLASKEAGGDLQKQYKYASDLETFILKVLVALAWDYQP